MRPSLPALTHAEHQISQHLCKHALLPEPWVGSHSEGECMRGWQIAAATKARVRNMLRVHFRWNELVVQVSVAEAARYPRVL